MKNALVVTLTLVAAVVVMIACNQSGSEEAALLESYRLKGDSISTTAQQTIFRSLTRAVDTGGLVYAVDFCSNNAMRITDSLSQLAGSTIQRLSNRNRNPANRLAEEGDRVIWEHFNSHTDGNVDDTLIHTNDSYTYYKPIRIAMPACLNCHGKKDKDLDPLVAEVIAGKYPNDLATGYQMNDLRGIWKITFRKSPPAK
ncbi:MAG: DUF3365 domain-containing protein [Sphingobacteriia bacterium]|nr:DUF3365 domain-containing protein [Sphingobacteriia bacterium]